jgi:putative membrane protein
MRIDKVFDAGAQQRVKAAVQAAEAQTRGQIVPAVVARSGHYPEAGLRGAIAGAALFTGLAVLVDREMPLRDLVLIQLAGLALGSALVAVFRPLERLLIGRQALAAAVHERATRAFAEHGLHRTAEGIGVLLFASLLERSVVVLGDRGIDAKMGPEGWQQAVDTLVAALRQGHPADGFVAAIALCGRRLAESFPRTAAGGANELPDELQLDKR